MKKEDETLNKIFKILDEEILPPEGTKEKILKTLSYQHYFPLHSWLLEKFVKLAIPLSILFTIFIRIEAY